jgi:hypothetical protein
MFFQEPTLLDLAPNILGQGNAAFKEGRYEDAVHEYSLAHSAENRLPVYLLNRAMANLKLERHVSLLFVPLFRTSQLRPGMFPVLPGPFVVIAMPNTTVRLLWPDTERIPKASGGGLAHGEP